MDVEGVCLVWSGYAGASLCLCLSVWRALWYASRAVVGAAVSNGEGGEEEASGAAISVDGKGGWAHEKQYSTAISKR